MNQTTGLEIPGRLGADDVYIQFGYEKSNQRHSDYSTFRLDGIIVWSDKDLDTTILRLKPDSRSFPPPIRYFGRVDDDPEMIFVGHPGGDVSKSDQKIKIFPKNEDTIRKAEEWSLNNYHENGYHGLRDKKKVLFHCTFQHGASGAPGFTMQDNIDEPVVVVMMLRGFPSFYYDKFSEEEKRNFDNAFLIEQGVTLKSIYSALRKSDYDMTIQSLAAEIFGNSYVS